MIMQLCMPRLVVRTAPPSLVPTIPLAVGREKTGLSLVLLVAESLHYQIHLNILKHLVRADGQLGAGMPARLTAAVCLPVGGGASQPPIPYMG